MDLLNLMMKKIARLIYRFLLLSCLVLLLNAFSDNKGLPSIDYILISKKARTLSAFYQNQLIRQYKIALGFNSIDYKQQAGDGKTPEGRYFISAKIPNSQYHLALKLSYPSTEDKLKAIANKREPGGDIMIHGLKPGFAWLGSLHIWIDWTRGCIAVTNSEIEEIYYAVKVGTPVDIKP
jgi:murein L,D-transpeptidase YafK